MGNCTEQQIEELIRVNLTAPILLTHLFAKLVPSKGRQYPSSKILFFADSGAVRPWRDFSVYCAAKSALLALTQSLAKELAPRTTVNAIAPGIVEGSIRNRKEAAERRNRIPTERFVPVEEVVEAVLFLLRTDSMTGQVLVLDGGSVL